MSRSAALLLLAMAGVVACSSDDAEPTPMNQPEPDPAVSYAHGVASGDPATDRVILWTRITPDANSDQTSFTVTWEVATDEAMTDIVANGEVTTSTDRDLTVKVDAMGLSAGQTYYYRFTTEEVASPIGRTKTLPTGTVTDLKFAVVSCSHFAAGYFNVYRMIANRSSGNDDLDAVLHLGDYFYEYGVGEYADNMIQGRAPNPDTEVTTLAEYRTRHAQYKSDVDAQAMHAAHPMIAVWDDHESANDAWLGGAENHDDSEGPWDVRRAAAIQAYYEWMPIREPAMGGDIFRQFEYGDLLTLTMLDTRLAGRSEQLNYATLDAMNPQPFIASLLDPTRSMLGMDQEAWVAQNLAGPRNTVWDLIGQQVMVAPLYVPQVSIMGDPLIDQFNAVGAFGDALAAQGVLPGLGIGFNLDSWDGYAPARTRLYDVFRDLDNVVVVTGDFHNAWANDLVAESDLGAGWQPGTNTSSVVGVEFITSSVTSPGFEDQLDAALLPSLNQLIQGKNPHIRYADLSKRGYVVVEFTPTEAFGQFYFAQTIAERDATEETGPRFRVAAGTKGLVPVR